MLAAHAQPGPGGAPHRLQERLGQRALLRLALLQSCRGRGQVLQALQQRPDLLQPPGHLGQRLRGCPLNVRQRNGIWLTTRTE